MFCWAFFLACILAFFLTLYLAFFLTCVLTFYRAIFLAFYLTFFLACLLTFFPACLLTFCLDCTLTSYLTFFPACILTLYLAFCRWGPAGPTEIAVRRRRRGRTGRNSDRIYCNKPHLTSGKKTRLYDSQAPRIKHEKSPGECWIVWLFCRWSKDFSQQRPTPCSDGNALTGWGGGVL